MGDTQRSRTISTENQRIAVEAACDSGQVSMDQADDCAPVLMATRRGYWIIMKKTIGKRLSRFMKRLWLWCKENRHEPVVEQHKALRAKLRGHYQYFGVRGNYKALEVVFEHAEKAWRYWLSRRSHKGKVFFEDLRRTFPLPVPRIVHQI